MANQLMETLAPMVISSYGDDTTKDLIKAYKQMDGVNNISDLMEMIDKIADIYTHITNYDEIMVKYTTLLNTVVPKRWHDRFRQYVAAVALTSTNICSIIYMKPYNLLLRFVEVKSDDYTMDREKIETASCPDETQRCKTVVAKSRAGKKNCRG